MQPPEDRLEAFERQVADQAAALARVPRSEAVPAAVHALLRLPPPALDASGLDAGGRRRLTAALEARQGLIDDLAERARRVGGRLHAVVAARRSHEPPHRIDILG